MVKLVHPVAVQVDLIQPSAVDAQQEIRHAALRQVVVVLDLVPVLIRVLDRETAVAEEVPEGIQHHAAKGLGGILQLRDGEEAVSLPGRELPPVRTAGHPLVPDHRHIELAVRGAVGADAIVLPILAGDGVAAAPLLTVIAAAGKGHLPGLHHPGIRQGELQNRLRLRQTGGDGGLAAGEVGAELIAAVLPLLQGEAVPVGRCPQERVVEGDRVALPLPGEDLDLGGEVGIAVGVGVVALLGVVEALQGGHVHVLEALAGILAENVVHGADRQDVRGAGRVGVVLRKAQLLGMGIVCRHRDAAVEELVEVDVLGALILAGQEVAADGGGFVQVPIEESLVEILDLRAGEDAFGPLAGGHRPGEGGGAEDGHRAEHGEDRHGRRAAAGGDAADALPELALPRRHGGGGEHGVRAAHGDQGEQGLAVGDALPLPQAAEGALVTGQLAVAAGGVGGDPDQGIEPVDREAEAADQAPEGV